MDNFVTVRVEDDRDDFMSDRLGIAQVGYPNIAVYDPAAEYVGRVVGFGGTESWFQQVQETMAVSEKLTEAKATAEKDPAAWVAVAEVLVSIPDRAKDAIAALDNVPARKQKSAEFKSAKARIGARAGWGELEKELSGLLQGVRTKEAAAAKAPAGIELVDAFLKEHEGASSEVDPAALAKKGFFLVILDKDEEALAIAKRLLNDYPESDAAKALLRGLR